MNSNRDWRASAYLKIGNWPEAIPPMGPMRRHSPYPWGQVSHDDPFDLDDYPQFHPNAGSIGGRYLGDVCPQCGVPVAFDEEIVTIDGDRGTLKELTSLEIPCLVYHPDCWEDRVEDRASITHQQLQQFSRTGGGE